MRLPTVLLTAATTFLLGGMGFAQDAKFEKDRKAILAIAGDFRVGFRFHETVPLAQSYSISDKVYEEKALETVKVVEDTGRRIVLQHILQAGPQVVKHWAEIWTYEDAEILEFQGSDTWKTVKVSPEQAKGTWSQFVTSVDDSPRYEGFGKWEHNDGSSEWSSKANRPLPRREYSVRKDYDLLAAMNRITVTDAGWYHEQDNAKVVKRDGREFALCREYGLNPYLKVSDADFSRSNAYWEKTASFWKDVRQVWEELYPVSTSFRIPSKVNGVLLSDLFDDMVEEAQDGKAPQIDRIRETLKPYVVAAETKP